jgi:hypothetical protein
MNGQGEETIYALVEQAELLAKTAMTQQEDAAAALKGLSEAARHIKGPLARETAAEVAAAVSDTVAKAAGKQVSEFYEAAAAVERAIGSARKSVEGKILYSVVIIAASGLIALAVAYAGTRWTYRAVTAERDGLRQELAGIQLEIDDGRRTLDQLENKTWGVAFMEQDGKRFVVLGEGDTFNPETYTLGKRKAFEIVRQRKK